MKLAIFAGSFDPITNGHMDVIERSLKLFDKLIIAVGDNVDKKGFLTTLEKKELIEKSCSMLENVEVVTYSSLTTTLFEEFNAVTVVRGVRDVADFQFENSLFYVNSKLKENFETIYLPCRQENLHISSSFVREILRFNGDVSDFVPKEVNDFLINK